MSDLGDVIIENTSLFYYQKEQDIIKENEFYEELFTKSLICIQGNIQMFNELEIGYELNNDKGKAVLSTEVLVFDEEVEVTLKLTLFGEYKEDVNNYFSYFRIDIGIEIITSKVYDNEVDLSIDYSNEILKMLEKRELKWFLNNFDKLYEQKK